MNRLEELRELYDFNRWANERVLAAAAALTEEQFTRALGSSFPSVRDTLVHIIGAEWIWLMRWRGTSPSATPSEWSGATASDVARLWAAVQQEQAAFLASLALPQLDEVIEYRSLAGQPNRSALWQMLRHVVNHSTYHRGQVTTMLRQLGAAAPATDLILYYRSVAPPLAH